MIAVVHDNVIEMVDLRGNPKMTKKIGLSKFEFDFNVSGMGEKIEKVLRIKSKDFVSFFLQQLSFKMTAFSLFILMECRDDHLETVPLPRKLLTRVKHTNCWEARSSYFLHSLEFSFKLQDFFHFSESFA